MPSSAACLPRFQCLSMVSLSARRAKLSWSSKEISLCWRPSSTTFPMKSTKKGEKRTVLERAWSYLRTSTFSPFGHLVNWPTPASPPADSFEPSLNWKYGRELESIAMSRECIHLWNRVSDRSITPDKVVSPTFTIEERMQVGIVARSCVGLLAASWQAGLGSGEGEEEYNVQHEESLSLLERLRLSALNTLNTMS